MLSFKHKTNHYWVSEWVTHWFAYCSAYWQQLVGYAIDIPACKQALQGTLAVEQEKEGELATTSLEFEFHFQFPYDSPTAELSHFRQTAQSGNNCKCIQTLKANAKGNNVITNVISANQHFASTFLMQIFKFQRRSCKLLLPLPAPPPECPDQYLSFKHKTNHY